MNKQSKAGKSQRKHRIWKKILGYFFQGIRKNWNKEIMCRKHIKENMFLLPIHLFIYPTNDFEHLHVIGIVLIIL